MTVAEPTPAPVPHQRRWPNLSSRASIAILVVTYLGFALTFTFLTRAWDADDEPSHTQYVEYIVAHHSIPRISPANGLESVQPPLYYSIAAAWQTVLGIPAFQPDPVAAHASQSNTFNRGTTKLVVSPEYNPAEHRHAVDLHEIRLISLALGVVTVLSTYAAAHVLKAERTDCTERRAGCRLLPRELVLVSSVTNDALVIPLCSLALLCFLLAQRFNAEGRTRERRWCSLRLGFLLGTAAITKFNSLPVAAVLFAATLVSAVEWPVPASALTEQRHPHRGAVSWLDLGQVVDGLLSLLLFFVVSGWWFIRNQRLYGQLLATTTSERFQREMTFILHPVPLSISMFVHELPETLWWSLWYLQPGSALPPWINDLLILVAIVCLGGAVWGYLFRPGGNMIRANLVGMTFFGLIVAGVIAVLLVMKSVSVSEARLAYVALSAWAIVLVYGATFLTTRFAPRLSSYAPFVWPAALVLVDVYVLTNYLVPFGGL